ncbi:MAG: hypothetical protein FH748_01845 [Balneolaceae bacterium]|nr:hypothetical protein [Balneolaceae bacterium]
MFQKKTLFIICTVLLFTACKSSFEVSNVDYAHRIESVLIPEKDGQVYDQRHGLHFNILPIQQQEFNDIDELKVDEVRLIRNSEGYYFITANGFNHVYVMEQGEGKLILKEKIKVAENGLIDPAFNLRSPYVHLLDQKSSTIVSLTSSGINSIEKEDQS